MSGRARPMRPLPLQLLPPLLLALALLLAPAAYCADPNSLFLPPLRDPANLGGSPLRVCPDDFEIHSNLESDIIKNAIFRYSRYGGLMFPIYSDDSARECLEGERETQMRSLRLQIEDPSEELQFGVDESYRLTMGAPESTVHAKTIWGAMHALTTFAQAAQWVPAAGQYLTHRWNITDFPVKPWREVLLDSARHFHSVKTVLRFLDAMSLQKYNVLHWTFTNSQSVPLKLDSLPNISLAAFSPRTVYTSAMLRRVVRHAKYRGIRVVPEVNSVAHVQAWWVFFLSFALLSAFCFLSAL